MNRRDLCKGIVFGAAAFVLPRWLRATEQPRQGPK
ncbi:unnamed protein product, partial [marine sediment metagenome]